MRGVLAIDLDGTVVHRGLVIYRRDRRALQAAIEAGLVPVVTTGRRRQTARRFADDLGLRQFPVITCDGAIAFGPDGETLFDHPLPEEAVRRASMLCGDRGVSCAFTTAEANYFQIGRYRVHFVRWLMRRGALRSPARLRRALWDLKGRHIMEGRFNVSEQSPVYKIVVLGPGADEAREWLLPELEGTQATMPVGGLELVAAGVDKSSGIERLIGPMGFDWSDVVAIGNDWNDLSMIERAGFGVAMGDAPKRVREVADYVTVSVGEGGVAEAIGRYLGSDI